MKKKIYAILPFIPRVNYEIGVWLYKQKVRRKRPKYISFFADKQDLKVNIGCGDCGVEGWSNLDYSQYSNVNCLYDCRTYLPFSDNSVKLIFTEHFFEHIDYVTEVPIFLNECFRSLQKGGVLRIIVPDGEKFLRAYVTEGWEEMIKTRPLTKNLFDELMGYTYETKMQLVNEVFRQSGEHKFAWDYPTLELVLKRAGFKNISKKDYLHSSTSEILLDQEYRKFESLYVEAIK